MYFIFLILSAVGGSILGNSIYHRDIGLGFLGLLITVVSIIACGYYGFPA